MTEREIFTTALVLKDEYDEEAYEVADERRTECLCQGDMRGARRWARVGAAVVWLDGNTSRTLH